MNKERMYNRIAEIAAEEFEMPKEVFSDESEMYKEPIGFDALMMVELMFTIEEEFPSCNIEFDNDKFVQCKTFGEIVRFFMSYVKDKEKQLEHDLKLQDDFIEQCKKHKEEDTWLFEGVYNKPRPKRKVARVSKSLRKPSKVDVSVNEMMQAPIHENRNNSVFDVQKRHGRYHRRERNNNDTESSTDVVQGKRSSRPALGSDNKRESIVATGVHE